MSADAVTRHPAGRRPAAQWHRVRAGSEKDTAPGLDGEPHPGTDPRGRESMDRYIWHEGRGLRMVREMTLPSGKPAGLVEVPSPGDDADTVNSEMTVWVAG